MTHLTPPTSKQTHYFAHKHNQGQWCHWCQGQNENTPNTYSSQQCSVAFPLFPLTPQTPLTPLTQTHMDAIVLHFSTTSFSFFLSRRREKERKWSVVSSVCQGGVNL